MRGNMIESVVRWVALERTSLHPWAIRFERGIIDGEGGYWNFALFCDLIPSRGQHVMEGLVIENADDAKDVTRYTLNLYKIPYCESDLKPIDELKGVFGND